MGTVGAYCSTPLRSISKLTNLVSLCVPATLRFILGLNAQARQEGGQISDWAHYRKFNGNAHQIVNTEKIAEVSSVDTVEDGKWRDVVSVRKGQEQRDAVRLTSVIGEIVNQQVTAVSRKYQGGIAQSVLPAGKFQNYITGDTHKNRERDRVSKIMMAPERVGGELFDHKVCIREVAENESRAQRNAVQSTRRYKFRLQRDQHCIGAQCVCDRRGHNSWFT